MWYKAIILSVLLTGLGIWCFITNKKGDGTSSSVEDTEVDLWDLNITEKILV